MLRKLLLGAALASALVAPAAASDILLKDFKRIEADPQKHEVAVAYAVGAVNGIMIGAAAEAKMQTGHSGRTKSICPDVEENWTPQGILAAVKDVIAQHPEMPDNTLMSAVAAYAVGQHYKCQ